MGSDWPNDPDNVLRGMWGAITSAAATGGAGAQNIWSAIKDTAASWAEATLSVTSPVTPSALDIQTAAHNLIGNVTILDVNNYRSLAGQYLAAKQNLAQLGYDEQITGNAVFTAPWSTTASNPAVPTRYRITVLRDITVHGFTAIDRSEWATYELQGPLTTLQAALDQANALFNQAPYNKIADIRGIVDYSIETV